MHITLRSSKRRRQEDALPLARHIAPSFQCCADLRDAVHKEELIIPDEVQPQ